MYILTYRFSLLGDFQRFVPTTTSIIEWTQALSDKGYEFLPSILDANMQIAGPAFLQHQPIVADKRVQFTTSQGDMLIRVLGNRIDFECTFVEVDDIIAATAEKESVLSDLSRTLLGALNNPTGNRVALYVDAFLPEGKHGAFNGAYSNSNFGLTLQNAEGCVEWGHRFNTRVKLTVSESATEVCNTIVSLESAVLNTQNKVTGERSEVSGLHFSADINTLAESVAARFDVNNLVVFCKSARELFTNLYPQIQDYFTAN